jgi:response regulator of citrate/malate metabolism
LVHIPVRTVVVDDDFMIAKLHGKFIDSQPGYQLAGIAHNYEQALLTIKETEPNLLLLDVFMPDRSGIDLLREIRALNIPCDAILITAANELEVVEEGFRFGVFDYLIKPFDLNHLQESLKKYAQFKSRISTLTNVNQGMVDDLKKMRSASHVKPMASGIDSRTLERIKKSLALTEKAQSAEEIAKAAGVSRSTARTYLAFLVEESTAEEELIYGAIGRPQRVFRIK